MNPLRKWFNSLSWRERRALWRNFRPAKGKHLDNIGRMYGVERLPPSKWWWPFAESDRKYRARLLAFARAFQIGAKL